MGDITRNDFVVNPRKKIKFTLVVDNDVFSDLLHAITMVDDYLVVDNSDILLFRKKFIKKSIYWIKF